MHMTIVKGLTMRTTIDIPEDLINEAMILTKRSTKTEVIKEALYNLIQKEKIKEIKNYYGKVKIDLDLDKIRKRS